MKTEITLNVLGCQAAFLVTTDAAGNLLELYNPTSELPLPARKLAYDKEVELLLPTLACVAVLMRVAVPLAAHGMLPYAGLDNLKGTATQWPEDLGGTGERPTRAEGLGYGQAVAEILKNVAAREQKTAGLHEMQSGLTPLIIPFIYAVAEHLPEGKQVAARRLFRWPSVENENLVLTTALTSAGSAPR